MTPSDEISAPSTAARKREVRAAMRRTLLLTGGTIALTGIGLAACVAPAPEPPAPAPTPTPTPVATPTPVGPAIVRAPVDWLDQPITAGDWTYRSDGGVTRALFGDAASGTRFTIACEAAARQVKFWRAAGDANAPILTFTTTEGARSLSATRVEGAQPQIVASVQPYDPLLDQIVFTRGRFAVQAEGTDTLYLPSWGEIARVVEDCR